MLRPSVGPVSRSRAASGAPIRPPREGRGGRRGPGPAVSGTGVRLRDPSRRSAPSRINERPPVFDPERTETIRTVLPRSDPAFPSLSPGGRVRAGSAPPVGHRPRPAPPRRPPRPAPAATPRGASRCGSSASLSSAGALPVASSEDGTLSSSRSASRRRLPPAGLRLVPAPARAPFSDPRPPRSPEPRLCSAEPSACLGPISRAARDSRRLLCVSSPSQSDTTVRWE